MRQTITKRYTFEASHQLEHHQGQCARLHGHSYKLEVSVAGPVKELTGGAGEASDVGMILDFSDLSRIVKGEIIERLDHQHLNDLLPVYPTAENIALWMWARLTEALPAHVSLHMIRLWETESGHVTISR